MRSKKSVPPHRVERLTGPSLRWSDAAVVREGAEARAEAIVDCGWGRLIFAHTFPEAQAVVDALRAEGPSQRDIAFYLRDPHVVLALAPQELFLDPSHSFRLWLSDYRPGRRARPGFSIAPVQTDADIAALNRIYKARRMVTIDAAYFQAARRDQNVVFLAAHDDATGDVLGVVMGVDHRQAFDDPEHGSSLWSLAVDPQAAAPGVGEALVRRLAERFQARGRAFMDLSVMHDNTEAIALYEKLGFQRIPAFAIKRRNPINEALFSGPTPDGLNPYARIIVAEALRRGIAVDVLDAEAGYFCLGFGGRAIHCRESLSELTSAVAMSRCDDKALTRRVLDAAGLALPAQQLAGQDDAGFLAHHRRVVVKPARGEQGAGIAIDLSDAQEVEAAIGRAKAVCDTVLLEEFVEGDDLRILVINDEVVAAAIRRPPEVTGTGRHTVAELIERQSRRRQAATAGESRIPLDAEAERCVRDAGLSMRDVPPAGRVVRVRRTANLHTGGTIHDVTSSLHPALAEAAIRAAQALRIPVVGLDFMVPSVEGPDYRIIEANERPGLANHEPQPTAERFIDLLFPQTAQRRPQPRRETA